jgi:hypothetical protein
MEFSVVCDNLKSYPIVLQTSGSSPNYGKPVVLVRCDRLNSADNDRGLALANKITDYLNSLPMQELDALLKEDQFPRR